MQAHRNQPQEGSVAGQPVPSSAINQPVDPSIMDSSTAAPAEVSDQPVPGGAINQPVDPPIMGSSAMAQPEASDPLTSSGAIGQQPAVGDSSTMSRGTAQPEVSDLSPLNRPEDTKPNLPAPVPPSPAPNSLEKALENENKFKTELKNKNFFEAFASVVKDVVQLEILTLVEDEVDLNHRSLEDIEGQPGKRMVTIVNLLNGDIKNIIGSRFVENNAYMQLREYHSEQVLKSHQIIKDNLDCLSIAIKDLIEIYKEDKTIKEEENQRP